MCVCVCVCVCVRERGIAALYFPSRLVRPRSPTSWINWHTGHVLQHQICVYVIHLTTCVCFSVAARLKGLNALVRCGVCVCRSVCVCVRVYVCVCEPIRLDVWDTRVAKGFFSGLEAPKIFGLRFVDESHHKNSSTALTGGVCCAESPGGVALMVTCVFWRHLKSYDLTRPLLSEELNQPRSGVQHWRSWI